MNEQDIIGFIDAADGSFGSLSRFEGLYTAGVEDRDRTARLYGLYFGMFNDLVRIVGAHNVRLLCTAHRDLRDRIHALEVASK